MNQTQGRHIPRELSFGSELLCKVYMASEVPNLADELIAELISETSEIATSVAATKEDAEYRIARGEFVDLDWLKRVRVKYSKVTGFKSLLLRELDTRRGLHGENKAVAAIKREKAKLDAHEDHQARLKTHNFHKRKFFHGLIRKEIGEIKFEALAKRAYEMANAVAPDPGLK
jgi:hypothetical protein